jgi:hypothetical protein
MPKYNIMNCKEVNSILDFIPRPVVTTLDFPDFAYHSTVLSLRAPTLHFEHDLSSSAISTQVLKAARFQYIQAHSTGWFRKHHRDKIRT